MNDGTDPEVNFGDPTKNTTGNSGWCEERELRLSHTDGNTGELDSHTERRSEALLFTAGELISPNFPLKLTYATSQLG